MKQRWQNNFLASDRPLRAILCSESLCYCLLGIVELESYSARNRALPYLELVRYLYRKWSFARAKLLLIESCLRTDHEEKQCGSMAHYREWHKASELECRKTGQGEGEAGYLFAKLICQTYVSVVI
jgi:hypothetical protein